MWNVATSPRPWIATTMFKMAESEVHMLKSWFALGTRNRESCVSQVRSSGWKHIEDLRAAVQAGKTSRSSQGCTETNESRLQKVAESWDISESHMKEATQGPCFGCASVSQVRRRRF